MSSRIFSCFVPQDPDSFQLPHHEEQKVMRKSTINASETIHEHLERMYSSSSKLKSFEQILHQQCSPIKAEVVQCGNDITLKQPDNIGSCEKPCMNGLELVLNAYESAIEENSTEETLLDQDTSEQEDSFSSTGAKMMIADNRSRFGGNDTIQVLTKPLYKISKDVQYVGKHVKNSKTKISWHFRCGDINDCDAVEHNVTLTWSKYSYRVSIHINGVEVHSTKVNPSSVDPYFVYQWNTSNGLKAEILAAQKTKTGLILWKHDLSVNGQLFDHFLDLNEAGEEFLCEV